MRPPSQHTRFEPALDAERFESALETVARLGHHVQRYAGTRYELPRGEEIFTEPQLTAEMTVAILVQGDIEKNEDLHVDASGSKQFSFAASTIAATTASSPAGNGAF